MTEQDKVTVDDIIGIVKTEEQTNSVEEVRKLRGRGNETAKRFQIDDDGDISEFDSNGKWVDCWMYANGKHWEGLCNELNHLNDENKQLKLSNINLEAKVVHLLDILQEKGSMTYEEVHEWWNSEVMK